MGGKAKIDDVYTNMQEIYSYFECASMGDLLHLYTLEDGMLLALIMSNSFVKMHESLGLDPANFSSTAKFSYVACKRLTGLQMQTVPNQRVFDIVQYQKRAGYSVIGREVSVASPTNRHVRECQFSPSCLECAAFVKSLDKDGNEDVPSLLLEIERVVVECNGKIPITTTTTTVNVVEEEQEEKKKKDVDANRLLRSVTEEYAELKKNGRLLAESLDPATEELVVFFAKYDAVF